jgi:hypothetical protein
MLKTITAAAVFLAAAGAANAATVHVAVYDNFSEQVGSGISVTGTPAATGTFNSAVNGFTYDWTQPGTVGGFNATDTFAAYFTGEFNVPSTGSYQMTLGTDDAGYLFVDNSLVASVSGQHSVEWAYDTLNLSAGLHSFKIEYDNSACCGASASFWLPQGSTISGAVPEPSTWVMLGLGFLGLGFAGYRRARHPSALQDA